MMALNDPDDQGMNPLEPLSLRPLFVGAVRCALSNFVLL